MAYLNSGLNNGGAQTAGLAIQLKTTYNRTLLENARDKLVHDKFARKYTIPKRGGTTMEFRKANVLPTHGTPLQEGVIPTEDTFGYTSLTVTINQYGAFVKGTDVVTVVTLDPLLDNITEEQGVQAGLTIEEITRDALNLGTNVQYANNRANRSLITATDYLTGAELVKARRTMMNNKVPPVSGRNYAAIVGPFVWADLIQDTSIIQAMNAGQNGGERLFEGQLMRYMGIDLYDSTTTKMWASGSGAGVTLAATNIYSTLVFGKNAYGTVELESMGMETIFHPVGSSGAADPLNQFWSKGWKCSYAVIILQQLYMLRIESAARP